MDDSGASATPLLEIGIQPFNATLAGSAKRERRRRRQTLRPNGNEQRRNDKPTERCPGPYIERERRVEGFGPIAFPVPPSSSGACLGGVPPEIGLEALALPTSRLLMAVGHDYYNKVKIVSRCSFALDF
ncbi:hypothetical protein KSP40_PGU010978 [Platanthera guangdongensis]|uniref:Uncharacterized protein n=1 Tax=Platanthera guangdongensis TaxID=2320717 RepID=A0ABR2M4U1_9ASPA